MLVSCGPLHWLWVIFWVALHSGISIFVVALTAIIGISCNILAFPSFFLMSLWLVNISIVALVWLCLFGGDHSQECQEGLLNSSWRDRCLPLPEIPRSADIVDHVTHNSFIILFNKCVIAYWPRGYGNWLYQLLLPTGWSWWTKVKYFIISSRTHLGITGIVTYINGTRW